MTTSTPESRATEVKARAAALGFDACGIAEAGPIDPDDRLGQWLAQGYHADMDWMDATRPLRQDIRLKLPGACSVVVLAANYYAPRPECQPHTGRVSRYAWGRDYHNALRKPLRALAAYIEEMGEAEKSYCCIDTGPVLERAWAERASVGWTGKNTMLIHPEMGSWLFLSVIAATVELSPDAPAIGRCGTCTACMDACPTGAIVAPGVLDARRCIAYHTVESRGDVPEDLAPAFGDWLFGCDACQEACPWNRKAAETSNADFRPRQGHANPGLDQWESMSEEEFKERFAGSPIRRARYTGMRRNAAIVKKNNSL
ncbi:MAG: tRNA epoxyqueuosine(34) reductase QueG [Nitrospiraceae bacterium]|nr:tRNA epoxyqueuosine(34) reductase QueG [Nitrospiraceae bacterium]